MKIRVANGTRRDDITLPAGDADLTDWLGRIGITDIQPKCMFVTCIDEDPVIGRLKGQIVNLDEVNYLVKRLESLTDYEKKVMSAYAEEKKIDNTKDLINLTFSLKGLSLITDFTDKEKVGKRLYLDEFLAIPASEENNIDFAAFVEKTIRDGHIQVIPYGVLIEHGFGMQEVYNGRTFPLYFYDPDKTVAVVEIENMSGDVEYLYLPTDICSMGKVMARLGVEDSAECRVARIDRNRLPEGIIEMDDEITDLRDLTGFNELCQSVSRFDEAQMEKLSMAAEFVGAKEFADITWLAWHLHEFEIVPGVHNDEEYGKYLVEDSGLFTVDDLLLPHIDHAGLAKDKRQGTAEYNGYVQGGFVGTNNVPEQYLQYKGEFADPLTRDERTYGILKFYVPLSGIFSEDGCGEEEVGPNGVTVFAPYEDEIHDAVRESFGAEEEPRGLMHYFDRDRSVAAKVFSAYPDVSMVGDELYGVMECKVKEPLNEEEIQILKNYLSGQMSDGWGEGFEQHPIHTEDGDLYVSFWNSDKWWEIMTEGEFLGEQTQENGMGMSGQA